MASRRSIHLDRLRKDHEERVENWCKLTADEQIASLYQRPGECRKQLARIKKRSESKKA